MFNDYLIGYEDKMLFIFFIVDLEEDCECMVYRKCSICKLIERGILIDIWDI